MLNFTWAKFGKVSQLSEQTKTFKYLGKENTSNRGSVSRTKSHEGRTCLFINMGDGDVAQSVAVGDGGWVF